MAAKGESLREDRVLTYVAIYFFGIFSGVVAYLLAGEMKNAKEAEKVRFHGIQAIVLGAVMLAVSFVPFIGIIWVLVWLYGVYLGYVAGRGGEASIPYVSGLADMYK